MLVLLPHNSLVSLHSPLDRASKRSSKWMADVTVTWKAASSLRTRTVPSETHRSSSSTLSTNRTSENKHFWKLTRCWTTCSVMFVVLSLQTLCFLHPIVVVAFRCEAYDGMYSGGYDNLGATVASILLLPEARSSGVHIDTVTPSVRHMVQI